MTSSNQQVPRPPVVPLQAVPISKDTVIVPKAIRGAEDKPATSSQTQHRSLAPDPSASPEIASGSPVHSVPRLTPSPAPVKAQMAAPHAAASEPAKNPLQPGTQSEQERSGATIADAHTETTQTDIQPAASPLAPVTPRDQAITDEQLSSMATPNLLTEVAKPQPLAGDQGEATSEMAPPPPVSGDPLRDEAGNTAVVAARMVEGIGQSEMHIDLRTQAFGAIDVHTGLRDTQLGLSVSSERGDLRGFLSPEMPALQSVLRQHDVHFENIRFLEHAAPASAFSSSPDSHSNPFRQGQPSSSQGHLVSPRLPLDDTKTEISAPPDISLVIPTRLNVHA